MLEELIHVLICPISKQDLVLTNPKYNKDGEVETGELKSTDGKYSYPVIKGIPRFVQSELYAKSFGYEWSKWSSVQYDLHNEDKKTKGSSNKVFSQVTQFTQKKIEGKLVVDFGCGGGRYMDQVLKRGGIAIGIDMSLAVEPAKENLKGYKNKLIIQADVLNTPFKDGVFDYGFSIGVLHHTPTPEKGAQQLIRTVKTDGTAAVLVYDKDGWYGSRSVRYFRKFINTT